MNSYPRLIMLGAENETRGSIAAVVDAYRAHGLFQRWPIDYVPTHGDARRAAQPGPGIRRLRRLRLLLARHRRALVHLHLSTRGNPARDAAFMAAALAARCPLVLQLHGAGFEQLAWRPADAPPARAASAC